MSMLSTKIHNHDSVYSQRHLQITSQITIGLALQLVLTKVKARAMSMFFFSCTVIKTRQISRTIKLKSRQFDYEYNLISFLVCLQIGFKYGSYLYTKHFTLSHISICAFLSHNCQEHWQSSIWWHISIRWQ